jgi:sulfoxide reductase heme-binding subunit YedZ
MFSSLTHGPLLWFLNRGTGVTLLVVLSVSLSLGILTVSNSAGRLVPKFVPQTLHRNLSILALALVLAHATTAVVDTFVDIRWWQALLPWGATYKPFWLELGTLSFDLMLLVGLTTWARTRLTPVGWRRFHLVGYACLALAVIHGARIGTDAGTAWGRWTALGCTVLVLGSLIVRLTHGRKARAARTADLIRPGRRG